MRFVALGQALIEHDLRTAPYSGYEPLRQRLRDADVVLSDLETALVPDLLAKPTREGVYFHSAPPQVLDCLCDLSINLLALANNHSFDLGEAGIDAAMHECGRRGIGHAGTGESLGAAAAPGYLETRAGRVSLVAFASKVPDISVAHADRPGVNHLALSPDRTLVESDRQRVLDAIAEAARTARLVIACHHDHYWEADWHQTPDWKRAFARACIEAGAHAYASHGVPLLHGIELYRGRPLFYGLGNFIFHTHTEVGRYEASVWESVLADCRFDAGTLAGLRLDPIALNEQGEPGERFLATRGRPRLAQGDQARAILERLRELSGQYGTTIGVQDGYAQIKVD